VFRQPDCRLSQEGQVASFPIDHITPSARGNATEPSHLTLACISLPPAGNWVRSACPIPPWFVVSFDLSTTNTRANWLRSGTFLSPRVRFLRLHWPLATVPSPPLSLAALLSSHAPRFTPHAPRSSCPPSMPRAEPGAAPPTRRGQHATTCHVFRFREKFGEPCFRRKLIFNDNLRLFLS